MRLDLRNFVKGLDPDAATAVAQYLYYAERLHEIVADDGAWRRRDRDWLDDMVAPSETSLATVYGAPYVMRGDRPALLYDDELVSPEAFLACEAMQRAYLLCRDHPAAAAALMTTAPDTAAALIDGAACVAAMVAQAGGLRRRDVATSILQALCA